jgi:starch synthase (maltosyl-transferring)
MAKRPPTKLSPDSSPAPVLDPARLRRVVIENVEPQIDSGRFPIKRTIGEQVRVRADVFADGHDDIAAVVRHRRVGEEHWHETLMAPVENDRWQAAFTVDALGRYEYTVEAWIDRFASWRHDLSKKVGAGQDVSSELVEGAALIRTAIERHPGNSSDANVLEIVRTLSSGRDSGARIAAALSEGLEAFMATRPDRSQATSFDRVLGVIVDRERARCGAW